MYPRRGNYGEAIKKMPSTDKLGKKLNMTNNSIIQFYLDFTTTLWNKINWEIVVFVSYLHKLQGQPGVRFPQYKVLFIDQEDL